MTINKEQKHTAILAAAINRYAQACVDLSWAGSYEPQEADTIRWEAEMARESLKNVLQTTPLNQKQFITALQRYARGCVDSSHAGALGPSELRAAGHRKADARNALESLIGAKLQ